MAEFSELDDVYVDKLTEATNNLKKFLDEGTIINKKYDEMCTIFTKTIYEYLKAKDYSVDDYNYFMGINIDELQNKKDCIFNEMFDDDSQLIDLIIDENMLKQLTIDYMDKFHVKEFKNVIISLKKWKSKLEK